MKGSRRAASVLAAAALVAAGGAIAFHSLGTTPSARSAQSTPSPAVIANFSILGREELAGDALPTAAGVDATLQRKITTNSPTFEQWASLNGEEVCVIVSGSAVGEAAPSACNSSSAIAEGRELLTVESGSERGVSSVIAGLAPDGVKAVEVTFTDGTAATAPVAANGFHLLSKGKRLRHLTWSTPTATYHEGD
jgi:hypothetical protein